MVILDPNGMAFDAVCVFAPEFQLLFKSSSSYCGDIKKLFKLEIHYCMENLKMERKMQHFFELPGRDLNPGFYNCFKKSKQVLVTKYSL